MMNTESIVRWLESVGVPTNLVSINVEADNTWCLLHSAHPESFEVFWREQGNRYDWARFSNEQVACYYLFGRLTWSQVARGSVGILPRQTASSASE